jgi:hypothetical protein
MISLKNVLTWSTVILLISSLTLFVATPRLFADSSDTGECASSFTGTLSEPFNAEPVITINATKGNYDVEFDYAVAVGDSGTSRFVNPSAAESSPVILVEGETISALLTSGEPISEGAIRLYRQDVSDCDILFNSSSISDSQRLVLSTVSIEEQEPSKFLVRATIPDAESASNFTKLVVAYVTNPEASVSYNIRNVTIVDNSEDGSSGHFLLYQSGKADVKIGKIHDSRTVALKLSGAYDCNSDGKPHFEIIPGSLSGSIVIHNDGAAAKDKVEIELHNFDISVKRNDRTITGTASPIDGAGSVSKMKWILPEKIDCFTPTDQDFPTGKNLIHAKIVIDGEKYNISGERLSGGIFFTD